MGLLTSNHAQLLKEVYPPPPKTPSADLPSPISNPLGKLTFYAVNRPHKTPKVVQTLVDRARTARAASSGIGSGAGKARADLAVTVEITRALVVEWGESGKDEAPGVIKNAVAEGALRVAELALGGGDEGGAVRQQRRDAEMEARGASLFHAVATFLSPPFFATQLEEGRGDGSGMGQAYLRCLSLLSALAQVAGEAGATSRYIALKALDGAVKSEFLVTAASVQDYDRQVEEIVPALLWNLVETDVVELRNQLDSTQSSKTALQPLSHSLSSRKSSSISSPTSKASVSTLSSVALPSLLLLSRLAPSPHALTSILSALTTFLDRHSPSSSSSGGLWQTSSQPLVLFLARDVILGASSDALKSTAAGYWVDRVADIYDTGAEHKSITLVYILKNMLTASPGETTGVSNSSALYTLLELLVRRARFRPRGVLSPHHSPNVSRGHLALPRDSEDGNSPSHSPSREAEEDDEADLDPLLPLLYSTFSTLARSASTGGYRSELSDLAADIISLLRALTGTSGADRAARLLRGMSEEEKRRARQRVSKALRVLIEAAEPITGGTETRGVGEVETSGLQAPRGRLERNEGSAATLLAPTPSAPAVPPSIEQDVPETNGAAKATSLSIPGLHLGAVVGEGEGDATVRAPRSSDGSGLSASSQVRPPIPQQILVPPSPSSSPNASHPSLPIFVPPSASSTSREAISISTFLPSLVLLTAPSPSLRLDYVKTLRIYLAKEALPALAILSGAEQAHFWRMLYGAVYALASGDISSAPPSSLSAGSARENSSPVNGSPLPATPTSLSALHASHSPSSEPTLPIPADYSALASLLPLLLPPASPASILEGVPVLLALDGAAATNWEVGLAGGEFAAGGGSVGAGVGGNREREKACRELAAVGMREVGRRIGSEEVERIGEEALATLAPFIIPSANSPASYNTAFSPVLATHTTAALSTGRIIDALSSLMSLQRATGLGRAELAARLGRSWDAKGGDEESTLSPNSPYSSHQPPSRSFLNLSLGTGTPSNGAAGGYHLGSSSRGGSTLRLSSAIGFNNPHGLNGSLAPSSRHASLSYSIGASLASHASHTPSLADLQSSLGTGGSGSRSVRTATTSAAQSFVSSAAASEAGTEGVGGRRRRTSRLNADTVLERVGQRRTRVAGRATEA